MSLTISPLDVCVIGMTSKNGISTPLRLNRVKKVDGIRKNIEIAAVYFFNIPEP
jgi:hypothetical protein